MRPFLWLLQDPAKSSTPLFCTLVHNFAQPSPPNFVDAKTQREYLPRQIEPASKNFTAQFRGRNNLTVAVLEIEPRSSQA
jgi:hypothetical protein